MAAWPAKTPLSLLFVFAAVYLTVSAFNYGATASEDAEAQGSSSMDSMTTEERRLLR